MENEKRPKESNCFALTSIDLLDSRVTQKRAAECRYCQRKIAITESDYPRFIRHNAKNGRQCFNSEGNVGLL